MPEPERVIPVAVHPPYVAPAEPSRVPEEVERFKGYSGATGFAWAVALLVWAGTDNGLRAALIILIVSVPLVLGAVASYPTWRVTRRKSGP
jgi:hypothetical protein